MVRIVYVFEHWYWSDDGIDWYSSKTKNYK